MQGCRPRAAFRARFSVRPRFVVGWNLLRARASGRTLREEIKPKLVLEALLSVLDALRSRPGTTRMLASAAGTDFYSVVHVLHAIAPLLRQEPVSAAAASPPLRSLAAVSPTVSPQPLAAKLCRFCRRRRRRPVAAAAAARQRRPSQRSIRRWGCWWR